MSDIPTVEQITAARERITPYVIQTPLVRSDFLSDYCEGTIYLKLENRQKTGSFKVRGALNRLLQLTPEDLERGVITASTGNHAQGVGYAAQIVGTQAAVVVPKYIEPMKLEKIEDYSLEVIKTDHAEDIEYDAIRIAKERDLVYVSPYDETDIIAGQGTITLEIFEQLQSIDNILIPVGGGGLISGISIVSKTQSPATKIIGVQSEAATAMYSSLDKGEVVEVQEEKSLAEALLGGLIRNAMTLQIMQDTVDEMKLVSEGRIQDAIHLLWTMESQQVEGAGAVPVAFILENAEQFKGKRSVAVISGGNISSELLEEIVGHEKIKS